MHHRRFWQGMAVLALGAALAACSSKPASRAPVEDRSVHGRTPGALEPAAGRPLPGAENAGKPGYYTVRRGDTIMRIGLETGQNWRDLVRWNNLDNPNLIEVGQVLRVVPPVAGMTVPAPAAAPVVAAAPAPAGGPAPVSDAVVSRPVSSPAAPTAAPLPAPGASAAPVATASAAPPQPTVAGEDEVAFVWPAAGTVVAAFDEQKNKGIGIAGKAGDPVLAAADGRVVYAGAGLRGYGNLIILKHNNTYLTAYAHNQTLLVKEDQTVRKGQKIAEMGSTDADRVKLHFEVRRQGKPVDPAKYLPGR